MTPKRSYEQDYHALDVQGNDTVAGPKRDGETSWTLSQKTRRPEKVEGGEGRPMPCSGTVHAHNSNNLTPGT